MTGDGGSEIEDRVFHSIPVSPVVGHFSLKEKIGGYHGK